VESELNVPWVALICFATVDSSFATIAVKLTSYAAAIINTTTKLFLNAHALNYLISTAIITYPCFLSRFHMMILILSFISVSNTVSHASITSQLKKKLLAIMNRLHLFRNQYKRILTQNTLKLRNRMFSNSPQLLQKNDDGGDLFKQAMEDQKRRQEAKEKNKQENDEQESQEQEDSKKRAYWPFALFLISTYIALGIKIII
jgi:hypothetical protein